MSFLWLAGDNESVTSAATVPQLLVVYHSRTGTTRQLVDGVLRGARAAAEERVVVSDRHAFDAGPEDVVTAAALILATPANFGYMSGAMKDFFERIYHPCLERTTGLPHAIVLKGDTDVDGALAAMERIISGLGWRRVLAPVCVVGPVESDDVAAAQELGAAMAAGVAEGLF